MHRLLPFILLLIYFRPATAQEKIEPAAASQKLFIDSINPNYYYLQIVEDKLLQEPLLASEDTKVILYKENYRHTYGENVYLTYHKAYWPLPYKNGGFFLDSLFVQDFFASLIRASWVNQGGHIRKKIIRREMPEEVKADNRGAASNEYWLEVEVTAPIRLDNSIARFTVGNKKRIIDLYNVDASKYVRGKVTNTVFWRSLKLINNNFITFSIHDAQFKDSVIIGFNDNTSYFGYLPRKRPTPKTIFDKVIFDSTFIVIHNDKQGNILNNYNPYDEYFPEYYLDTNKNLQYYDRSRDLNSKQYIESSRRVPYSFSNMLFNKVTFNADIIFQSSYFKDVNFNNCNFNGPLFLKDKTFDTCLFQNCKFQNLVDLRNTNFIRSTFKGSYFKKSCNVLLSKEDPVSKLSLDLPSFEKIFFIIDWGWNDNNQYIFWNDSTKSFDVRYFVPVSENSDTHANPFGNFREEDLEVVKIKYQQLNEYLKSNFKSDDLLGSSHQKISNRFYYQVKQYEQEYYKRHNILKYYWLCFLEKVVNFGYEGEMNFFGTCLMVILLFSLIYAFLYQREVTSHLTKSTTTTEKSNYFTREEVEEKSFWQKFGVRVFAMDLFRAFYFSFIVFFSPRFPMTYFNFSKGLVRIVIFEWLLGIFFIILFFVYIAGNYPIITKLLGI